MTLFGKGEIPPAFSGYAGARAVVLTVPYEGTVSYGRGTGRAPAALLNASYFLEYYDETLNRRNYEAGIATLPPLKAEKTPEKMVASVEKACDRLVRDNKFIAMVGGEHSISFGLYRALRKKYPDLSVLQIDAHGDLRDSYEGSPYSHACVMRRITASCRKTAQVGIRSICAEEAAFIRKNKRPVYMARDITGKTKWIPGMLKKLSRNVFVTIDIDGFDPSVVPHTGTPEPGGLGWYEGLNILHKVFEKKNVVGFDLVELASSPISRASDFLAAKLVYHLIGCKFKKILRTV
ncbi:MAG: agmatinase [Fibrobacterota bacterium]